MYPFFFVKSEYNQVKTTQMTQANEAGKQEHIVKLKSSVKD